MAMMPLVPAALFWTMVLVLGLVSAFKDQKNITAESGQNVTLTCQAAKNNIIVLEWSRADLGRQYVFLHRDGLFVPDGQHPSFVNRVDLQDRQMKDGDASLILNNVTTADSGTYACRAVMGGIKRRKRAILKTDPISIVSLRVVDPPGQLGGDTEDGGKEDEIGRRHHGGLVAFGLLLAVIIVVVAVVISKKKEE